MLQPEDLIKMAMEETPQSLQVPALKEEEEKQNSHSLLRRAHDAVIDGATIAAGAIPAAIKGIQSLDNPTPTTKVI